MSTASVLGVVVGLFMAEPIHDVDPPASVFADAPRPESEPLPGAAPTPKNLGAAHVRASAADGFGLDSADGRFGLSLGILAQLRYAIDVEDGEVDPGFSLRLGRTMVRGHMWDDRVVYQLQTEFSGRVRLLDANAILNVDPAFAILAGQYRPWFTRGFPTNLPLQALPDRGSVLDAFRVNRDIGVTVLGRPFDGRMEYYLGVMNGEGLDLQAPRNPQPLLTARLVGAPLGSLGYSQTTAAHADKNLPFRFAFATNVATNEVSRVGLATDPETGAESSVSLPDLRTVVVGGDVALQGWRMIAMGEGFWRRNQEEDGARDESWGAYGLLSGVLVRHRLDLSARVGALRLEGETRAHMPVEPGLNLYVFADHAKLQVRYRCDVGLDNGSCRSQGADLQAQLWF